MNNNAYYNLKKLALSIFWVVLGIVLVVLSMMDLLPSDMWSGIGGALIGVGIMQTVRNVKYNSDPTYKQKIDIAASDERNRYLRMKAWSWAGYICVMAFAAVSLIALAMGHKEISRVLSLCMCAEVGIFYVSYLVLQKKY